MRPLLALLLASALAISADEVDTPKAPKKNDDRTPKGNAAQDTAENAMKSFAVAPGLKVDVWAAEPLLENPIAFSFDHLGRAFVAVTQRRRTSVPDIRKHEDWQIENFSLRTVEDRIAFLKAKMPESPAVKPKKAEDDINKDGQFDWRDWAVESEEIRIVENSTGAGRADKSRVLASGFNNLETGLGAGVLAMPDGGAIYTCVPDLWRIAPDGTKTKLATGFGVHVAFGGHDMHGVKMGPDGRIYFTIADCGAHVMSKDGKVVSFPDGGAVFRCWPNGDALELYAWGLRNPQSLAFNDAGDLFTGDNNADGGDKARWIHVVEGADYGWRIGWQFLPKLGAWNSEGMWHLDVAETNAAILPPVAHITHGPAGIAHYPGTGLPEKYRDNFFVADFPGGVRHFALKQKGASYEVDGMAGDDPILQNNSPSEMRNKLLWNLYPSDVQFPPGGGVCVLDWVYGWEKTGKGRIYRVHDPVVDASAAVQETKRLLAEGMAKRTPEELAKLLGHADQRVRIAAQFALVEKGEATVLAQATLATNPKLMRLHGIWGITQLVHTKPDAAQKLMPLAMDADAEVRAQWAKFVGETRLAGETDLLIRLLGDKELRVRFQTIMALAKLAEADPKQRASAMHAIIGNILEKKTDDPFVRHAAVVALAVCAPENPASVGFPEGNASMGPDSMPNEYLVSLLALRRKQSPAIDSFLPLKNPRLRLEAVRAIHDAPIPDALPKLAALDLGSAGVPTAGSRVSREPSKNADTSKAKDAPRSSEGRGGDTSTGGQNARPTRDTPDAMQSHLAMMDTALTRRVINANYRLSTAESAKRLATIAANGAVAEAVRLDALEALAQWPVKLGRDRVLGIVVAGDGQRNAADAAAALAPLVVTLLGENSDAIRIAALNAAGANKLTAAAETITMLATNSNASGAVRAATLDALAAMDSPNLGPLVVASLESSDKTLAEAARKLAGKISPAAAVKANAAVLGKGGVREQQQALATIAAETGPEADAVIAQQLDLLLAGKVKAGLTLDLLEAATSRKDDAIQKKLAAFEAMRKADDPLARWRECIEGGDSKAGKVIFAEKAEAACMRCHKVKGEGGDVGPDLAEVGKKMGREYVLRSIVDPNAVIAKGYDNVMVTLKKGDVVAGLLSAETADELSLKNPADAKLQRVKKADVKERMSLPSAMPPGIGEVLTKRELRDLVQYLSALK
jgi:quinoprotein glucose dehydrogenase